MNPPRKIPLNDCTFGEDEIDAAIAVLRSGMLTMGQECFRFEDEFARKMDVPHAVFVNSGSSANLLVFFALANPELRDRRGRRRLTPGSEVIVPAVTWSTTIWPVVQAGGVPVLVDCDPATLQLDVDQVKKAISEKTVAICPVHVLGNVAPMAELTKLADEHGLWLIEDTCESLGTKQNGRWSGTFGDFGTYSFYFSHHITTIEGGMVVCKDDEQADLLRCLRAHGWTRHMRSRAEIEARYKEIDPRFLFVNTGFNLRPTEINAAFGLRQLTKLQGFNRRRREIVERWTQAFTPHISSGELRPMQDTKGTESAWFGYPVLLRSTSRRNDFRNHLEANGIETRPVICGNLARQPAFKLIEHRVSGLLKGADEVMDRGLFWGCHPVMQTEDLEHVVDTVNAFFKGTKLK